MSIPFFISYEETINYSRYGIRQNYKKNFGKLRPIERRLVSSFEKGEITAKEQEYLQLICSTIRNWMGRSLAHKHRLKGVELYESMQQIGELIPVLRAKKDHEILEALEDNLKTSIAGLEIDYQALQQGKTILDYLTDLLYGAKDDKGNRNTQAYKELMNAKQIQQDVEQFLKQSHEKYKKHSSEMRAYLRHFQNTYLNWFPNLFTCYDYPAIPNDNNRLELSHSQMKKQHRRITGQHRTAKYLKIHGEQAAFTLHFGQHTNCQQELMDMIRKMDNLQFEKEKRKLKQKSKERGKTMATKQRLNKMLDEVLQWGEI